jgi:lambda family phage portal protein
MADKKRFRLFDILNRKTEPEVTPTQTPRKRNAFAAGFISRLTADFLGTLLSPDQQVEQSMIRMRARAQDLARNNAHAKKFLDLIATNVVGSKGIQLQPRIKDSKGDLDVATNAALSKAFLDWGKSASLDGRLTWIDVQNLIIRLLARDGEVYVRKIVGSAVKNKYKFALQIYESDLLDHMYNLHAGSKTNEVRQGIEIDQYGTPLAYHFFTHHPSEPRQGTNNLRRIRVPAEEVYPIMRPTLSASQTRGVTWLHAVIDSMNHLAKLKEAELISQRSAANMMVFMVRKAASVEPSILPDANDLPQQAQFMPAEPGAISVVPDGYEPMPWNPTHPSSAFSQFCQDLHREIAAGMGVSYSSLTGDYGQANYSSERVGLINERDQYRDLQTWFIRNFHEHVYADWIDTALLVPGLLQLGSRSASKFMDVAWRPRGWSWIDPQKEAAANAILLASGLTSRTHILSELGENVEDRLAEQSHENELAKEYDVSIDGTKNTAPVVTPPNQQPDGSQPSDPNAVDATPADTEQEPSDPVPPAPKKKKGK